MRHTALFRRLPPLVLALSLLLTLIPSAAIPARAAADSAPQITILPNDYVSKPTDQGLDGTEKNLLGERFWAYQIFSGTIDPDEYDPNWGTNKLGNLHWGTSIQDDPDVRNALLNTLGGNTTLAVNLGVTFDLLKETKRAYLDAPNLAGYKAVYDEKTNWENEEIGGKLTAAGEAALRNAFDMASGSLTIGELFKTVLEEMKDDGAYTASKVLADFTPASGNIELARSFYAFVFDRNEADDGGEVGSYKYLNQEPVQKSRWISVPGGTSHWGIGEWNGKDLDPAYYTENAEDYPDFLPGGYYMIWDAYSEADHEGKANASYMAAVYGYGTIELKSMAPRVTKTGNGAHELGETISFTLEGSLPENFYTAYKGYPYIFEDTFDAGLDFDQLTRVYVRIPDNSGWVPRYDTYLIDAYTGDAVGNTGNGYRFRETSLGDKTRITVALPNLQNLKGRKVTNQTSWEAEADPQLIPITGDSKIYVVYTAKLNEGANITNPLLGNKNSVVLSYANNPLWDPAANFSGGTWDTNWQHAPIGTSTGTVFLYDFGVHLTIYDGKHEEEEKPKPLAGAGFALKRDDEYAVLHANAGTYYLTGWVSKDDLGDLSKRDWGAALEAGETIGGFTVPAAAGLFANDDTTDAGSGYYLSVTTQSDGVIRIVGMANGPYTLEEVAYPQGYDAIEDVTVNFSPSYIGGYGALDSLTATVDGGIEGSIPILNASNYVGTYQELVVRLEIENEPEPIIDTGGIGTTLFYIGGGALLGGALLLLIFSSIKRKKGKPKHHIQ